MESADQSVVEVVDGCKVPPPESVKFYTGKLGWCSRLGLLGLLQNNYSLNCFSVKEINIGKGETAFCIQYKSKYYRGLNFYISSCSALVPSVAIIYIILL